MARPLRFRYAPGRWDETRVRRDIYDDLDFRAKIIERAIQEDILGYHEVDDMIDSFQRDGIEGLPFDIHREI